MPPKLKKTNSGSNQKDYKQETGGGEQGGLSTTAIAVGAAGVATVVVVGTYLVLKK